MARPRITRIRIQHGLQSSRQQLILTIQTVSRDHTRGKTAHLLRSQFYRAAHRVRAAFNRAQVAPHPVRSGHSVRIGRENARHLPTRMAIESLTREIHQQPPSGACMRHAGRKFALHDTKARLLVPSLRLFGNLTGAIGAVVQQNQHLIAAGIQPVPTAIHLLRQGTKRAQQRLLFVTGRHNHNSAAARFHWSKRGSYSIDHSRDHAFAGLLRHGSPSAVVPPRQLSSTSRRGWSRSFRLRGRM